MRPLARLSLLLPLLASAPAWAADGLTMSGPIDRRLDQAAIWCQSAYDGTSLHLAPSIAFTADGPEATIEIVVLNEGFKGWMQHSFDNLCVVTRATFETYFQDSSACFGCGPGLGYLRFDLVPPAERVYFERFDIPDVGGWTGADIYYRTNSAPRALAGLSPPPGGCMADRTGGSLGIGFSTTTDPYPSARRTIGGLTAGTEYVFTFWWNALDPGTDPFGDLQIDVYGTEPWTDVTPQWVLEDVTTFGASWADYDGDADPDLFITRVAGAPNRLLRNDGGAAFEDVASPALADAFVTDVGAAWGDSDNDGDLDLFFTSTGFPGLLFRNDGGPLVEATPDSLAHSGNHTGVTWADYDRDGDLDLYMLDSGGTDRLNRNDGTSWRPLLGAAPNAWGTAWGDYDADGDPDFYTARDGANVLYRNEGPGGFTIASAPPLNDSGIGRGVAWGDYDNDLDLDLYLANGTGTSRLFRNDGAAGFANVTPAAAAVPSIAGTWGDLDNDGDLDLCIARQLASSSRLMNQGDGTFVDAAGGPFPFTAEGEIGYGFSLADFDGDGDLDAYLATGSFDRLLRNDTPPGFHWLHVDLVGTVSNRFGLGARILVTTGALTQLREVSSDPAYFGQNSVTAEFGLGQSAVIDGVVVRWPSGIVQPVHGVPVDARITIVEGDVTGVPVITALSPLPRAFRAFAPRPNPFGDATEIRFELPAAAPVSLAIYDVSGRLVRRLVTGRREAGAHAVTWDGRDEAGSAAAAGVYFYRLRAGADTATRKVTYLNLR